ncbi:MAG: leucine-rich repeat domain-containing protein, partial [Clostridia bacterium]|nr:leucine-rich repeat domain-containing protein [Clostridia bacterium]
MLLSAFLTSCGDSEKATDAPTLEPSESASENASTEKPSESESSTEEESVTIDPGLVFTKYGDAYTVTDYTGNATRVVIPSTYQNLPVTSIGEEAFYQCTGLTSIEIPSSVTSIGSYAFKNCTGLTCVTFGENSQLTSIGESAFSSCRGLTSIEIPASVTSIGERAFSYCDKLVQITNLSDQPLSDLPFNPDQEIRTSRETAFKNVLATDENGVITYTVGDTVYLMGYIGKESALDLSSYTNLTEIY